MWVWQSQAPAGTSKFTCVAGWAALARTVRVRMMTPAAIAPSRTSRRVGMGFLLGWNLIRCMGISVYRMTTGGEVRLHHLKKASMYVIARRALVYFKPGESPQRTDA